MNSACRSCGGRATAADQMATLAAKHFEMMKEIFHHLVSLMDLISMSRLLTILDTWSRFLVKQLNKKRGHSWHKFNIFTHWVASTQQTFLLVFESTNQLGLRERFPDPLLKDSHNDILSDPFWFYPRLFEELSWRQDNTVWAVRDLVRGIEMLDLSKKPNPDYRDIHNTARHAIHVSETLEVAEKTVAAIVQQHSAFQEEVASDDKREKARYRHVSERMIWYDHILQSLRCRASANKERLYNEIQLAFNSVAQYDSRISVQIGQATQSDSAAMKTIAFVTLTFLPATFVSALFSMSFFNIDDDTGKWSVSEKFWLYWVIAIPVTLLTGGLWLLWRKVYQPPRIGEDEPVGKKYRNLLSFMKRGGDKANENKMV
jgi:Mg2+ and Co2+ transporter CorA